MKIIIAYTRVTRAIYTRPVFMYNIARERFLRTYRQFKPAIPHELVEVCLGPTVPLKEPEFSGSFSCLNDAKDCGAYQELSRQVECDWLLCLNAHTHFHRAGWLERFMAAVQKHGDGLYGATGSYEVRPHIRTPSLLIRPEWLRKYPRKLNTLADACDFECGPHNLTRWMRKQGRPTLMVTWDEALDQPDWRTPPNIFRRGDQSNCLIWDRHTFLYQQSGESDRLRLELAADGQTQKQKGAHESQHTNDGGRVGGRDDAGAVGGDGASPPDGGGDLPALGVLQAGEGGR